MLSGFTRYLRQHVLPHFVTTLEFLQPAIQSIVDSGGVILTQAAEQAVAAVEADPWMLSNTVKRDAAIAMVLEQMKKAGIAAGENAARIVVETAVAKLKAVKVDAASSAPAAGTLDAGIPTE